MVFRNKKPVSDQKPKKKTSFQRFPIFILSKTKFLWKENRKVIESFELLKFVLVAKGIWTAGTCMDIKNVQSLQEDSKFTKVKLLRLNKFLKLWGTTFYLMDREKIMSTWVF